MRLLLVQSSFIAVGIVAPDELEYRSAGTVLVLVDSHANLIVDILPALLAGRDLRH